MKPILHRPVRMDQASREQLRTQLGKGTTSAPARDCGRARVVQGLDDDVSLERDREAGRQEQDACGGASARRLTAGKRS